MMIIEYDENDNHHDDDDDEGDDWDCDVDDDEDDGDDELSTVSLLITEEYLRRRLVRWRKPSKLLDFR